MKAKAIVLDPMWVKALDSPVKVEFIGVHHVNVTIPGGSTVGYRLDIVTHKMEIKMVIDFNGRDWNEMVVNEDNQATVAGLWELLKKLEFQCREDENEIRTSAARQYFEEG